ncbi:MAG: hypothetical protein HYX68_03260 [Planctomycetes bacterium]|nr:hypothetical protein [Planctomycetota bacterium]
MAAKVPGPWGMCPLPPIDEGTLCLIPISPIFDVTSLPPVKYAARPLVMFFGGAWDAKSTLGKLFISWDQEGHHNMKRVCDKYNHPPHISSFYTWDEEAKAVDDILREIESDPELPLCLVGHSFGGDSAISVAKKVHAKSKGYRIELVVTLDAVSPSAHFVRQKAKPANVHFWFNVYVEWELEWNNLIAAIGGHWGEQKQADSNVVMPKGIHHNDAVAMFDVIKGAVWNFHALGK